jgi:hypothetical protein
MSTWKMPPKAKIYEAMSAVADGRVAITGPAKARVTSSSHDKIYDVEWSEDASEITSNDNASYWQGYTGYPIIAVLMETGRLSFDIHIAKMLAGVSWKELNTRFKRNYEKAVDYVLSQIQEKGVDRSVVVQEVDKIYEQLGALGLKRVQSRGRLPKGK